MKTRLGVNVAALAVATGLAAPASAQSTEGPLGEGMTVYMQMGGNPGDGATLARQTGAAAAAQALRDSQVCELVGNNLRLIPASMSGEIAGQQQDVRVGGYHVECRPQLAV